MSKWDRHDWALWILFTICIGLIIVPPMVGIIPLSLWEVIVFLVLIMAHAGELVVRKVKRA